MSSVSHDIELVRSDGSILRVTDSVAIGRSESNQLIVDEERVSRRQAVVSVEDDDPWIEDLQSSNGTRVNKNRIQTKTRLHDGDEILIGSETIRVRIRSATSQQATIVAGPSGTIVGPTPTATGFVQVEGGERYSLDRPRTIGRDADNDIALPHDGRVSSHHARIDWYDGHSAAFDLGSSNGTQVNGRRVSGMRRLKHRDRITIGSTTLIVNLGPGATDAGTTRTLRREFLVAGAILGLIAMVISTTLLFRNRRHTDPIPRPGEVSARVASQEDLERNALRAVVQIATPEATGSGSLLTEDGLVLTNTHVVLAHNRAGDPIGVFQEIEVRVNRTTPGERPNETYVAEVVKLSPTFDLALLRIRAGRGSEMVATGAPFPIVPLGNSDSLSLGAPVAVLGYPGIGGDYPTMTRGTMSGFMPDHKNGIDHGWIKTDTEINFGNSGGMAIDRYGRLIGVPTSIKTAFMSSNTPISAGKLGLIRPINAARMFLEGYVLTGRDHSRGDGGSPVPGGVPR